MWRGVTHIAPLKMLGLHEDEKAFFSLETHTVWLCWARFYVWANTYVWRGCVVYRANSLVLTSTNACFVVPSRLCAPTPFLNVPGGKVCRTQCSLVLQSVLYYASGILYDVWPSMPWCPVCLGAIGNECFSEWQKRVKRKYRNQKPQIIPDSFEPYSLFSIGLFTCAFSISVTPARNWQ